MDDVWGLGEYERVAERLLPVAKVIVEAAGVAPGQRVCDVAAGTGNVARCAAALGAQVTASDLSPAMVAKGRLRTEGLEVEWHEADAQDLPFADGGFDCSISVFGSMFAPDADRAARELQRVVKPGGVAAMTCWVAEGPQAEAMQVIERQFPDNTPPGSRWADHDAIRARFAGDVTIERREVSWAFADAREWLDFVEKGPGPMVAGQAALGDRWPAVREEMLSKLPAAEGPFTIDSPYLLILARR